MQRLAIIGSGHLGQLIAYHAAGDGHYEVAGFFDDTKQKGERSNGIPMIGGVVDIQQSFHEKIFDVLMIGIGYKHFPIRKKLFDSYAAGIPFGKIIHSSSYIDASCQIGSGAFILPGCVLDMNVKIADNVLLNTGCIIAHDSSVEKHSFLSPGVVVAGFVKIGACCNIGINTTIIDGISVANETQTGGGTVVINNIEKSGLYVGNPARFIR